MLKKKMLRDIMQNKAQFITIFIMIFLGVLVFSGVHSYMDGMKESAYKYYEDNNLEDLWLSGNNFTKDDLANVKKIDNVKDAERILKINTTLENHEDTELDTNFIESNNINKMYTIDGENFDINKSGVWVDSYLAKNLNLKVGDKITFDYQNYKISEKILGLINVPDSVYEIKNDTEVFPDHKDYGYVYLSIHEFPKDCIYNQLENKLGIQNYSDICHKVPNFRVEDYYTFNSIIVDVNDTSKVNETKTNIQNNIKSAIAVTDRNSDISYKTYNSEIDEGKTYSGVFTFLFLFIALLSVVTTMNRFVKKQRTQIGTLKALGIKNRKIITHYLSYGFFISTVASILGIIVGNLTIGKYFLNSEMIYYEIPDYHTILLPIVYILAIAVILVVTIVTYLSCRTILKEPASEALRAEMPKIKKAKFNFTTKGIFKRASLSTRWNLRDISRNKGRTIMAAVGIIGCTMLLVCAFGLLDSMNSYINWQFDQIDNFKYKLSLQKDYTSQQYNDLTKKYGSETSQTLGIEIKCNGENKVNQLMVNNATDKLKYTDHNRNYMNISDDGVYITEKLSKTLGLKIGDNITWHIFGDNNWYTTKIVGLNKDPDCQQLNMTKEYYEYLGLEYRADSIYTNDDLSQIKKLDGVKIIQSISNLKDGVLNMIQSVKTMVVVLIIISALLCFVIIYNLGVLSFSEKQYQFATLKVLGIKYKQIKKIFIKQNLWITVLSIVIGLPLGYYMTNYIFQAAPGDSYDITARINFISYIYAIIGILLVSLFVNRVLSKKVKTIDMVSSLKANE